MEFNERLRKIRKEAGLNQMELAHRVGISVNSIRLYEAGRITPNLNTLMNIARALGVRVGDLMDDLQCESIPTEPENTRTENGMETQLLQHFRSLNDKGQQVAVERVQELTQLPKYRLPTE